MDRLLEEFLSPERWEEALVTAVDKGIDLSLLRKLKTPTGLTQWAIEIAIGKYTIAPPRQQKIPKDNGEFRIVYINEGKDRIFLNIVNNILMDLMGHKTIHKASKAYQRGLSCNKTVLEAVHRSVQIANNTKGFKADLSKYFDSVRIEDIDRAFDQVEIIYGHSSIVEVLRKYYHQDTCYDLEGQLIEHYQSLKQGCAVASYLANTVLFHIDKELSSLHGYYVRYSDDILYIGEDYEEALKILKDKLEEMSLTLNPKKVELLSKDSWFKFLGFSIKGDKISLSKNRLYNLLKQIKSATLKKKTTFAKALKEINKILYIGNGEYSWAEQVISTINCVEDLEIVDNYIKDCLRAVQTNRKKIGGIGYEPHNEGICIRAKQGQVGSNRLKTDKELEGYYSLVCMRKMLLTAKPLYNTIISSMLKEGHRQLYCQEDIDLSDLSEQQIIEKIEELYTIYRHTLPDNTERKKEKEFFLAQTQEDYDTGAPYNLADRKTARQELETFVSNVVRQERLPWDEKEFYWHSDKIKELIILKDWF